MTVVIFYCSSARPIDFLVSLHMFYYSILTFYLMFATLDHTHVSQCGVSLI